MESIPKRQLLARASILIKKDFTNLRQNDLIKKIILMITMFYIVCQRVSSPWDRTQAPTKKNALKIFFNYLN